MAIPKVFQSFNSLLGGITRKKNATIVGPSRQLVGEFPTVTFERLYEYYHGWDQIKRAVDTIHQKFMGAGIEVKSNNESFNTFIKKWWDVANAEKKMGEFFFSVFITGNGILEKQYTSDGRLGNIEHIPMQTIYRVFRDQYGVELKLVQIVDGVFKELDPQFFIHWMINNPDRQAFGKSEFFSLASPRPVSSKVDPMTGEAINPDRVLRPLLDSQAVLQNAEVEIKQKMAKPRVLVSAVGMPRDQMQKIQLEMSDESNDQYIWIFDKPIESKELSIQGSPKFDQYGENIENHIDIGTGFASKVIKNSQGFSYSSSQTPFDVLDQRMVDLQSQASEMIKDRIIKPIAESWGFIDFEEMEVKISFMPSVRRLSMEDIQKLPSDAVSPEEKRELLKKLHIPLDDTLWDSFNAESKKQNQDQAKHNFGNQSGMTSPISPTSPSDSGSPTNTSSQNPFPPKELTPQEKERPTPTRTDTRESMTPSKIDYEKWFKEAVTEALANERITLPPSATNDSVDLYVSQGLDQEGTPEITDPVIRKEYGLDKDESPQHSVKVGDTTTGFSGQRDDRNKNGDEITNIDNGDQINKSSNGKFKDPHDLNNTQEETPDVINQNPNPHPRPNEDPMVKISEDEYKKEQLMESKPFFNNGNDLDEDLPQNIVKNDVDLTDNAEDKPIIKDSQKIQMDVKKPQPQISKLETPSTFSDNKERIDITSIQKPVAQDKPNPIGDSGQFRLVEQEEFDNEDTGDGLIMKPEEVRQTTPHNLHEDPPRNYTDDTDEQGNKIPDLRFDQTPDSTEDQPYIEPAFNIVTQQNYDDEKMSFDQFNNELEKPNLEKPNPFDLDHKQPENFEYPVLQNNKANEEITGVPADSTMSVKSNKPTILPNGKVVGKWKTKEED